MRFTRLAAGLLAFAGMCLLFPHPKLAGSLPAAVELSSLDGTNGFVIKGIDPDDFSGWSVSGAGDVNGDGIDDVIIGAFKADPNGSPKAGESYVVFGTNAAFPASLDLSSLDGTNGFVLNGIDPFDNSGVSVSGAGDVNGDGIDDVIIGAYGADPAGESYVVFGTNAGFAASLDLSSLDGTNGFVINGIDSGDISGPSVSGAGDVNGDGIDDLIIGAYGADPNGNSEAGESYVVFGTNAGFAASLDLSSLDGTNGFVINGIDVNDASGVSVSGAGDVNGDGIDDVIIGALFADPNGNSEAGESYVVFGTGAGFAASLDLSSLNGTNGFVINGIDPYDYSGESVSGAGDVNGDGIDDVIIGAFEADPNGNDAAGESYVAFGSDAGFPASLDLSSLDGTNGFVINGIDVNDASGVSVSGAGDVNGDGIDDVIIAADLADPNGNDGAGESYVVFGANAGFSASLDLLSLDGTNGFVIKGIDPVDLSGWSVSGAGDVNGDGIDDVIIGATEAAPNGDLRAGESYVVFGKRPLQSVYLGFGEVGVPRDFPSKDVYKEDGSVLMTLEMGPRAGFDPQELGYAAGTDRAALIREIVDRVRADYVTTDGRAQNIAIGTGVPSATPYTTISMAAGTYPDMRVNNSVAETEIHVEAATVRLALHGLTADGYYVLLEDGRLRRPDGNPVPGVTFPDFKRIRVDAYGVAQMLDIGNTDKNKCGWVFVGEHATSPTPDENLRELSNSISHELAHLLGLEHRDGTPDSILGSVVTYGTDKEFSPAARDKLEEALPPPGGAGSGGPGFRGGDLRTRQAKIGDTDQYGTSEPGALTGVPDADAAAIMREGRLLLEPHVTHEPGFEFDLGSIQQSDPGDGPYTDIALAHGSSYAYSLDLLEPGIEGTFDSARIEIEILNVADVLGPGDDFKVFVDGMELHGALDGLDQRISDPEFAGYALGERMTLSLQDYLSMEQIEAALADGILEVTLEVGGATSFVAVDSLLTTVTDRAPHAIRECGNGTVNLGGGPRADVLFVNGTAGGELRTVPVAAGDAIAASIALPPAGGAGGYVVHLDAGEPSGASVAPLPASLGASCFPFVGLSSHPGVAVWTSAGFAPPYGTGGNRYFGGPIPRPGGLGSAPPPAPATFLLLPAGDATNLPPGTIVTFQGLIEDPNAQSALGISATNAVILAVE